MLTENKLNKEDAQFRNLSEQGVQLILFLSGYVLRLQIRQSFARRILIFKKSIAKNAELTIFNGYDVQFITLGDKMLNLEP